MQHLRFSSVYDHLLDVRQRRGTGLFVLVDPDRRPLASLPAFAATCEAAGVDALLLGGSLLHTAAFDAYAAQLRAATSLPVVGFPGSLVQLSGALDAVLFLALVSGRNPEYLIGQHVHAAPLVRALGIEPLGTGYLLVESGGGTTALYMSQTQPLPRNKPELAAATALAAEMLGMRLVYADAGSGARVPIPVEMVAALAEACRVPLLVGGGLCTPEAAAERAHAGADFIVVGTAAEPPSDAVLLFEMAQAVHGARAPARSVDPA